MDIQILKNLRRLRRQRKVRSTIVGTSARPRLCVSRTNTSLFLQIIDDSIGKTLVSAHTREVKTDSKEACTKEFELGKLLAEKAKKAKIETVVFDRAGCLYHGRVKAAAEGAREGGLQF